MTFAMSIRQIASKIRSKLTLPAGKDWIDYVPDKDLTEDEWDRLASTIGTDNFVILWPSEWEGIQGSVIKHHLSVSPRGIQNLHSYRNTVAEYKSLLSTA